MHVRNATTHDIDRIAMVHLKSWQETYKGIVVDHILDQLSMEQKKKQWEQILVWNEGSGVGNQPTYGKTLVGVNHKDEVVAFAHFSKERTGKYGIDGELTAIYMLKEYHRKGLGSKLLQAGIEHLMEQKFKSMLVWALSENSFKSFYEKFVPIEVDRQFLQIGERSHEETAYGWKDLSQLLQLVIQEGHKNK